jgi:hypothetical protein
MQSIPKVFLSYAGEDYPWVKSFADELALGIGENIKINKYIAGDSLDFAEVGSWIDLHVDVAQVMICFVSEPYRKKSPAIDDLKTILTDFQRRRLIFVPVMLDSQAKNWWAELRRRGKLSALPDDYIYADFRDETGAPAKIIGNEIVLRRIALFAQKIRGILEPPPAAGAASRITKEESKPSEKASVTPAQRDDERIIISNTKDTSKTKDHSADVEPVRQPRIFISYRRDESKYEAKRIHDAFAKALPRGYVFMDIDSVPPGVDFVQFLEEWVKKCDILLALISRYWSGLTDPKTNTRRLDNPHDFVRIEISEALRRHIPVIPILLDDAPMPDAASLPEEMRTLVRRQGAFVGYRTFDADVRQLLEKLDIKKPNRRRR